MRITWLKGEFQTNPGVRVPSTSQHRENIACGTQQPLSIPKNTTALQKVSLWCDLMVNKAVLSGDRHTGQLQLWTLKQLHSSAAREELSPPFRGEKRQKMQPNPGLEFRHQSCHQGGKIPPSPRIIIPFLHGAAHTTSIARVLLALPRPQCPPSQGRTH